MPVYLHGLSTALPPHRLEQTDVERKAALILGPRFPAFKRMTRTFTTSGVKARYSVAPMSWFEGETDWADRNARYIDGALAMFVEASQRALSEAGWTADSVDVIVTISSTGIATPTLEARAKTRVGFRDDVVRVPVFGLGCAGGISGLTIARELASAQPGSRVLLVVVEVCTLSFRKTAPQKADIIATVLFGDGAAAACLSTEPTKVTLGRGRTQTWPDTLSVMGWDVDNEGLGVVFDRSIPDFTRAEFRGAVETALAASDLRADEIDRLICHPGGAKVIEAIEAAMEIPQGTLDIERDILRDFGNMSAPTVLFVLKAALERGHKGQMLACALGPGFSAAFQPISIAT